MNLYIIGGSNGAGKTTFAKVFLPSFVHCPRFVNPDLIAAGLSPFDPSAVAAKAGRLMLEEVNHLIHRGESFAFESTLSGKTYLRLIERAKERGYAVHLFYLWVPDAALAVARVRDRVETGGHDVPEADVYRRYDRTCIISSTCIVRLPILVEQGDHRVFSQSYAFTSPSAAGAMVTGRSCNAQRAWIVQGTAETYQAWEQKKLAEQR